QSQQESTLHGRRLVQRGPLRRRGSTRCVHLAGCANDGRTSLNTRQVSVLKAILSQAALKLDGTSILAPAQVTSLATDIATITNSPPLINKADLLARLATKQIFYWIRQQRSARMCGSGVLRCVSDAHMESTNWCDCANRTLPSGRNRSQEVRGRRGGTLLVTRRHRPVYWPSAR